MDKHKFTDQEISGVYRAIAERRDMRHFIDKPIPAETLGNLLRAAHQAGSVGLMQPWRFIRITDSTLRNAIHQQVEEERQLTAKALGERQDDFMKLKVEGILECAELLIVALPDKREQHIFGRRTLPEMDIASTACAIQNIWLAARAEGLGMGWVSLFDPEQLSTLLKMPVGSQPIAILCLGHVEEFYSRPMLELENWAEGRALEEFISENYWTD
ncbi:5,6-dimethylbenzimidazole synthase [Bathymodiolus platifrons methanotrophic gill symbiont]|uniref:5,6-dimethylbenzimidazole synthase n=1 Tax=Bathymodiolus platifrons methanotrophic gill symbiont TaxID=113268 RepID=UPI000B420821|nr:5,6-dimethylbenzimidazole synthase [Bathymodiolus platifrons methanotrophic gill symbiont]MCK5870529.1 5,6-dimethylbenzimidazole synthase [Methyloprofundus sp.]TXK95443.1 5,6-dimethylbenzimidazole synthase [Methylococcaceae bacterium CS4]TXK99820.1 5,6-dimethylbenzimidazole synthase [Methylococcaceae bacterium CS5]TXL06446.1 5,6-dimethylbenzimidazole synthase [Methylococcaceae bacterium CS1]TXL07206.1 5,6-dimethylbenzimidazole synthase [Methylococcaceae bacterium CS3]TXL10888.1 5,6-dimethy